MPTESTVPTITPDTVVATIRKEQGELAIIRARRVAQGIELYLKSEKLEAFFKSYDASASAGEWQGRLGYGISANYQNEYARFNRWGSAELMLSEFANLSFFLGKGLSEGYTIILPNTVATQELVTNLVEKTKLGIKRFYQRHLAPFSIEVEISFKEVS